jgi:hypothetical protein
LADAAAQLIARAERILEYTPSTFPEGTDHTSRHTHVVDEIARMVLPDGFLARLSDHELYFLALACHYHDLAMAGTVEDDKTQGTRDQVRRGHHIQIAPILRDQWKALGFENERTADILGEICQGHRPRKNSDGEANWDDLPEEEILQPGVTVRVRLLGSLIYAVDELHIGGDRAPKLAEEWRDIPDEESRRHWRRHQAISGPARARSSGSIRFRVKSFTAGFEENLRTHVLRKALLAYRDLRRQAQTSGIVESLPAVEIDWDRREFWRALLPLVCSDMGPRSNDAIIELMIGEFQSQWKDHTGLDDLCAELGNSDTDLRSGARLCVEDAIAVGDLVADAGQLGGYLLCTDAKTSEALLSRMREADKLDRLVLGRYQVLREDRLFASEFGRKYVAGCIFPVVANSYSVPLTQRPPDDPVRVVLESCPTAARLVRQYGPPPSNLVKEPLLVHGVITGALLDLYAEPERLLDGALRRALRLLAGNDSIVEPSLRFLEELALIGGFTNEQVRDAQRLSEAGLKIVEDSLPLADNKVEVTINQTMPYGAKPEMHLNRLLLASMRARARIFLASTADHKLAVSMRPEPTVPGPQGDDFVLEIGPAPALPESRLRLPARLDIDNGDGTIRFRLRQFSATEPTPCPLVVTLPLRSPERAGDGGDFRLTAVIHWPELTIGDLHLLVAANDLFQRTDARVDVVSDSDGALLLGLTAHGRVPPFRLGAFNAAVIAGLGGLDPVVPAPLFVPSQEISRLGSLSPSERHEAWQQFRGNPPGGRHRVSSIYLRMATDGGHVIEERFLGFFSFDFFPAPAIESNAVWSAENFRNAWDAAALDFVIQGFFEDDVHVLSQALLEWLRARKGEFPFRLEPNTVTSPVTRSALAIRLLRARDRVWHVDRPIIFEFRPVNRREAYRLEAVYWRSVNDERRAALADEIYSRLEGPPLASDGHSSA